MASAFELKLKSLEDNKKSHDKLHSIFKAKLKSLDEDDYLNELKSNLNNDANHLMIINSLMSLFYNMSSLGYQYFAVEPLSEINGTSVKNFDILFVKYEQNSAKIILVEVKSSIALIGKELSDFDETKKIYKQNKAEYERFVGETISHEDFVLAIPLSYKDQVISHIKDNKLNLQELIIWSVDPFKSTVTEIKQSDNHATERTAKRVHLFAELDPLFGSQSFVNMNPLSFTPKGHIVHVLNALYMELYHKLRKDKSTNDDSAFEFHKDLLKLIISDLRETDNQHDAYKERLLTLILEMGERYGLLKKIDAVKYKLRHTNNPYGVKETLHKEYVSQKMKRDAEQAALEEFTTAETRKHKSIFDF